VKLCNSDLYVHGNGGHMKLEQFQSHVREKLKYYVYIYRDPRNDEVFYVGKGKGNRAFIHLRDKSERRKAIRIAEIRRTHKEPIVEILTHGLDSEETALKVEAAVIDLLRPDVLTNEVRGHHSGEFGIMDLDQVRSKYDAKDTTIVDKVCLIRIRQRFRYGMTPQELYDSTRGIWRINPSRHDPTFAIPIYDGVVQEVYRIAQWFKAGSTYFSTRPEMEDRLRGIDAERYEFVGAIAEEKVRRRYRYKSIRKYLSKSSQNPILYVNC
jgi:uncharacterized protein